MEEPLLVAVVSALSALGGVAVAQCAAMFQSWLDRKHKKAILLRTKYEELTNYVNESLVWANSVLRATTFEELHAQSQPIAARKAYSLTLLYFPLLKQHADAYVSASVEFHNVLTEAFKPLGGVSAGAQAAKHSLQSFTEAGEHLRAAREALDAEIERCARAYISA